jgi:hypothetical protein
MEEGGQRRRLPASGFLQQVCEGGVGSVGGCHGCFPYCRWHNSPAWRERACLTLCVCADLCMYVCLYVCLHAGLSCVTGAGGGTQPSLVGIVQNGTPAMLSINFNNPPCLRCAVSFERGSLLHAAFRSRAGM